MFRQLAQITRRVPFKLISFKFQSAFYFSMQQGPPQTETFDETIEEVKLVQVRHS